MKLSLKLQTRIIFLLVCLYGLFLLFGKVRQNLSFKNFQNGERAMRSNQYAEAGKFFAKAIELSPKSPWSAMAANELAFVQLITAVERKESKETFGDLLSSSVIIFVASLVLVLLIAAGAVHFQRLKKVKLLEEHVVYLKSVEHRIRLKVLPTLEGKNTETFDGTADYQNYIEYYKSSEFVQLAKCLIADYFYQSAPENQQYFKALEQSYNEFWHKYPVSTHEEEIIQKLANLYFFEAHDYEAAKSLYRIIVEKYPQSKWIKIAQARIKLIEDNKNDFEALRFYIRAERYYELKKYQESLAQFTELINTFPKTALAVEAQYNVADIYMYKTNELERAISEYQIIINGYCDSLFAAKAQYKIGECYKKLQKFPEAIEAYEKFIASYGTSEFLDYALYYVAFCYEQIHDSKKALETYQQIVKNFSASIWVVVAESRIAALTPKECHE